MMFTEFPLQSLLAWLAGLSLATFLLSLLLIPFVVGRLKADCFLHLNKTGKNTIPLSLPGLLLLIARNLLGIILFSSGVAMLFLPGQGLLTMLLGILLLSFPGKQRLLTYLVTFPEIRRGLNWLRKKNGKQPFMWPG